MHVHRFPKPTRSIHIRFSIYTFNFTSIAINLLFLLHPYIDLRYHPLCSLAKTSIWSPNLSPITHSYTHIYIHTYTYIFVLKNFIMQPSRFSHAGIQQSDDFENPLQRPSMAADGDDKPAQPPPQARKGYVAIYVGEECKRYEVPLKYLSFPALQELIGKSLSGEDQIHEPKIDGPITLACKVGAFDELLKLAKKNAGGFRNVLTSLIRCTRN